ncbi:CPS_HP_G0109330.mRNA.1.CDS.1 [Saccharomyces cerevisiae]|nr:CPS_HP_G0057770.mRNA.1.CDS.1 [Saccharomyces cerevisiae]CAI5047055.1 CPS_HP_G0109330.mRNA.1.CDS.1 [Saccharomyces cerevisiae]CAI6796557.1 CPS_HP_G0057770.mRNA.1.CDS.1 [Saccharomyces cerevisiae]CAI6957014.1 CPS_HP_G0109330.mRNA.1.CDS.1 [Saccharomyces cerevisiae]
MSLLEASLEFIPQSVLNVFLFPHFVKINISLMERVMNHLSFWPEVIFFIKRNGSSTSDTINCIVISPERCTTYITFSLVQFDHSNLKYRSIVPQFCKSALS